MTAILRLIPALPSLLLALWLLPEAGSVMAQEGCTQKLSGKEESLYNEAISYFKKGNYTQTQILMKSVLKDRPDMADANFVMGLTWFRRAEPNLKESEKYFLKTIAVCPDYDVYAYYYLGEIEYGFERYDSVVQFLSVFLKDVDKIKKDADYDRATSLLNYSRFYLEMVRHPVPFRPEVVEGISTPENEYLPILSPDNQIAFFTRETKLPPDLNSLVPSSRMKEIFMFSNRKDDGSFNPGEEMPDPFNIYNNEGGATITADNRTLYYTVCQIDPVSRYLNCDIFYSEYSNDEWLPIKNAGKNINKPNSWESQPSISADGRTLYYVSDRPGGYGGYDVYKANRLDDGTWNPSVNMGPLVNSTGNEKSPFIHPDGQTLYFSSDGWPGVGGYDIFYTRLRGDSAYQKPINIGYPINTPDDEVGFFVSTDGTKGFFASNKFSGRGGYDLYSFDLYDSARPEKVLFIKGTVIDESTAEPVKARIELKNVETKKISEIPLDTNTGKYVAVASFRNDYVMTIKKEGYVYESKYISKGDTVFKAPAKVDVEIKPIELNKSYRINDIYFGFNSFDLTEESKSVLDQMIEFLTFNATMCIQIQGYTDDIGKDEDNLKLSNNRAHSVYNYLVSNGINPLRLSYRGFGETAPIAPNSTEEGRAKNRRTCFVISSK
jgi:outer membrane protein OmpA-like peptidoglycan-associated protein/tetratricopeptide (TPR) repeat protein